MSSDGLRELEHLVLLALSRLEGPVHAVPIVKELVVVVSRSISRASVYVVLRRLEVKGYVTSTMGDATPQRGGRAKRLYALTPRAVLSLKTAQQNFVKLWAGSRVLMCLLLVSVAATTTVGARSRPDLSGVWINLSDPNATDEKVASNLPNALLTIKHAGTRFDLTRSWSNAPIVESHVCDGRTNKNGYSIVVERTTCRWDTEHNDTLVIEGTIGRADGEVVGTLKQRYWLDDKGIMFVERTRNVTGSSMPPTSRNNTQQYRKLR